MSSHNAYLGDTVQTRTGIGTVYQVHYSCPESPAWIAGLIHYDMLTPDEQEGRGRWVSVLLDHGGAVVFPDRMVKAIASRPITNNHAAWYFRPEAVTT